jgi:hypothetical protein
LKSSAELKILANNLLDQIIANFTVIKLNYDDWRAEHNKHLPTHERLFITPYLKKADGTRRNAYLQWVRICSEGYLGKTNQSKKWQPREIKRGNTNSPHYTEQTLKSALSSYTKPCIPHLMDAEHSLVYLREQLKLVTLLFEISRSIKPGEYGLLAAKQRTKTLNDYEKEQLNHKDLELTGLNVSFDPLSLPKKLVNLTFSEAKNTNTFDGLGHDDESYQSHFDDFKLDKNDSF